MLIEECGMEAGIGSPGWTLMVGALLGGCGETVPAIGGSRYSCQCAATGAAGIGLRAGERGPLCLRIRETGSSSGQIMELQIERVGKRYSGDKWALREFSLRMGPGILGLLGPNGAGKTTLMSIIATITRPTEGAIHWNGAEVAATAAVNSHR